MRFKGLPTYHGLPEADSFGSQWKSKANAEILQRILFQRQTSIKIPSSENNNFRLIVDVQHLKTYLPNTCTQEIVSTVHQKHLRRLEWLHQRSPLLPRHSIQVDPLFHRQPRHVSSTSNFLSDNGYLDYVRHSSSRHALRRFRWLPVESGRRGSTDRKRVRKRKRVRQRFRERWERPREQRSATIRSSLLEATSSSWRHSKTGNSVPHIT